MITDIMLLVVGSLGLVFAIIVDVKKKEIPDWINYGMITFGFSARLMHSLYFSEWSYLLYGLLGFLLMFAVGMGFYYAKQWGGGDAKLLMALGVMFATRPDFVMESEFPFIIVLLMNIMIFGALYGVVYGGVLAIKHKKKFLKEVKFLNKGKLLKRLKIACFAFGLLLLAGVLFLIDDLRTRLIGNTLVLFVLVMPYVRVFVKAVENSCLYQIKKVEELVEGDWVEQDVVIRGKVIYRKKPLGIEKDDIERLKNAHVLQILVKEGIPFAPPFLFGLLATLILGNIVLLF